METDSDWSEQAIERKLDVAIHRHLPELAASLSGTAIEETAAAYRAAAPSGLHGAGGEADDLGEHAGL